MRRNQRTGYNTYNDNKYYTRRDRKNGPDHQDEGRDGTSRTTNCVNLSNTVMYMWRRPTRMREQEEILIMQELQPRPSSPPKKVSYNAGTRVVIHTAIRGLVLQVSRKVLIAGFITS